jgi:hypothetical protein
MKGDGIGRTYSRHDEQEICVDDVNGIIRIQVTKYKT